VNVVGDSVQQCAGEPFGAEDLGPFVEKQVILASLLRALITDSSPKSCLVDWAVLPLRNQEGSLVNIVLTNKMALLASLSTLYIFLLATFVTYTLRHRFLPW
jgi:hypothetical protein